PANVREGGEQHAEVVLSALERGGHQFARRGVRVPVADTRPLAEAVGREYGAAPAVEGYDVGAVPGELLGTCGGETFGRAEISEGADERPHEVALEDAGVILAEEEFTRRAVDRAEKAEAVGDLVQGDGDEVDVVAGIGVEAVVPACRAEDVVAVDVDV